jgi:hypothetical protein
MQSVLELETQLNVLVKQLEIGELTEAQRVAIHAEIAQLRQDYLISIISENSSVFS